MITEDQLRIITQWLQENVWRNGGVMYSLDISPLEVGDKYYDLVDCISSLHNLLCEAVTGKRYNYAFHWANKIGMWTEDNMFDPLILEIKDN